MLLAGNKPGNSSDSVFVIAMLLGLRIRKRLHHSLQESHELFATAMQRRPEIGFFFISRGETCPRQSARSYRRLIGRLARVAGLVNLDTKAVV